MSGHVALAGSISRSVWRSKGRLPWTGSLSGAVFFVALHISTMGWRASDALRRTPKTSPAIVDVECGRLDASEHESLLLVVSTDVASSADVLIASLCEPTC